MKILYGPFTLMAFAFISSAALAQPAEAPRLSVSFADLNLQTADGQAALRERIRRASEVVCGMSLGQRDLQAKLAVDRCMKQSFDQAVASIPAPSLMAGSTKPVG